MRDREREVVGAERQKIKYWARELKEKYWERERERGEELS